MGEEKKIMLFLNKNTEVSVDFIGCTLDAVDAGGGCWKYAI